MKKGKFFVPTKCSNLVTPGCQRLLQISINEEDLAKLEQSALERVSGPTLRFPGRYLMPYKYDASSILHC